MLECIKFARAYWLLGYNMNKLHCVSKNYTLLIFAITFLSVNRFSYFLAKNVAKDIVNMQSLTCLLLTVHMLRTSLSVARVAENMWCSTLHMLQDHDICIIIIMKMYIVQKYTEKMKNEK